MKKIYSWIIVATIIIGYFAFIHRINNKENIIKREPKSLFKFEEEQLQATITLIPTLKRTNTYTSATSELPSFSVNYPDNWSIDTKTTDNQLIVTIGPFNNNSLECIKIYQTKDNMPLLEAVNYSKYMLQKKDTPFFLKDGVETSVNGKPAHISKVRLNNSKPEEFVHNAVIVKDDRYTTIMRACPGITDAQFFPILQTLAFL